MVCLQPDGEKFSWIVYKLADRFSWFVYNPMDRSFHGLFCLQPD